MALDLGNFANPWEHVRLLSDAARNEAMLEVMSRHCPGKRVLEVGCGTGLLSCIAARMGATKVYAVEPTGLVHEAREMVLANGLGDVVEVIEGMVEEVDPREVDFAFSELLNADPFAEGVMSAMAGVRPWLAEGGLACPTRLRVYAALVREGDSAKEVRDARRQVQGFAGRYGLDLTRLDQVLANPGPYTYLHQIRALAGPPVLLWDLAVGQDDEPDEPVEVALTVDEPGPVGGAVVWFEAQLDGETVMSNRPESWGHWGQLVCGWAEERGVPMGTGIRVVAEPGEDGLVVRPV